MRGGRLRHQITLQRKNVTGRSPTGSEVLGAWITVATVWASIEPMSGRESIRSDRETPQRNTVITIRYRAGVTAGMRVLRGPQIWDIETVLDPEQRHRELQLVSIEQVATV